MRNTDKNLKKIIELLEVNKFEITENEGEYEAKAKEEGIEVREENGVYYSKDVTVKEENGVVILELKDDNFYKRITIDANLEIINNPDKGVVLYFSILGNEKVYIEGSNPVNNEDFND